MLFSSINLKSKKQQKRNDGARASAALVHLHQGPKPLDPFRRKCKLGKAEYFRQFRWSYEKIVGFWPKKAWEKYPGESESLWSYGTYSLGETA